VEFPAENNPQVFLRFFLRILQFKIVSCGYFYFRKFRRYSQGFSCGFLLTEQFPADSFISGNSAGISKDFLADFGISTFLRILLL
jgi:hypothetical protein